VQSQAPSNQDGAETPPGMSRSRPSVPGSGRSLRVITNTTLFPVTCIGFSFSDGDRVLGLVARIIAAQPPMESGWVWYLDTRAAASA
jgi:hypothetical protein